MKEKFITTNELANDASRVLRSLKKGEGKVILRYSKPVGVLISWEDYKKIENLESNFVNECKSCLSATKKQLTGNPPSLKELRRPSRKQRK